MKTRAQLIVRYLLDRGFTEQILSEICQVSQAAISKWATGKAQPKNYNMRVLISLENRAIKYKGKLCIVLRSRLILATAKEVGGQLGDTLSSAIASKPKKKADWDERKYPFPGLM